MGNEIIEISGKSGLAGKIENVLINGDLSELSVQERANYYKNVCDSLGLNPLTKPFDYIVLNKRLTLYARKDATEQLRRIYNVSIVGLTKEVINGIYIVTATARLPNGREDTSTGAVSIGGLNGEALANAIMKAETKSKRRVTLSICGLGMLDETEVEDLPKEVKEFSQESVKQPESKVVEPQAQGVQQGFSREERKPSEAQLKRLFAISKKVNASPDQVKTYISDQYGKAASKDLSLSEYDQLCRALESGEFDKHFEIPEEAQVVIEEEPKKETETVLPWTKYLEKPPN